MFPGAIGGGFGGMNPMMSGFMAGLQMGSMDAGGGNGNSMGMGMGGPGMMDPRMMMMMQQAQQMMMVQAMMQMLMSMMQGGGNAMGGGNPMAMGMGGPMGIGGGGGGGGFNGASGGNGFFPGNYNSNFNGNYGGGNNVGGAVPGGQVGQGASSAVDLGRQFLGQNSSAIRGQLPHFTAAGGQTNNCADFVSSLLESTGQLRGHHVGVRDLEHSLQEQGYHRVSAAQARPGDVWISNSRSHTEMVTQAGGTRCIGSNNDRPGHQVISERNMNPNAGVYYSRS